MTFRSRCTSPASAAETPSGFTTASRFITVTSGWTLAPECCAIQVSWPAAKMPKSLINCANCRRTGVRPGTKHDIRTKTVWFPKLFRVRHRPAAESAGVARLSFYADTRLNPPERLFWTSHWNLDGCPVSSAAWAKSLIRRIDPNERRLPRHAGVS